MRMDRDGVGWGLESENENDTKGTPTVLLL